MDTFELAIRWFKGIVLAAVAVWELVQLARHPKDLPLRVLAPGLVALAFAATLGIKTDVLDPLEELLGEDAWTYLINGSWSLMAYCFATYFLLANPTIGAARRKRAALAEFAVLVGAVGTMVVIHQAFPATWERPMSAEQYASLPNLVWYLSVDGYALTAWLVGAHRAQSLRRHLQHRWARASFWLVIIGSAAMTLGVNGISLLRQAFYITVDARAELDVLSTLYSTGQLLGQLLLAAGLVLAPLATGVVALRTRIERRRRDRFARQLHPLWQLLIAEFPHVAVTDTRSPAYERYAAEITDSLAELARDCPEPTGDVRDPRVAAEVIADGLARRTTRHEEGTEPDPEPPYPRLEPDFATWRERAQWMVAVRQNLRDHSRAEEHDATA